ncbi:MAG: plasmid replication, integration and excision activator [Pseudonocardia sp.]|uniref:plasmid replication, integration and excision activator n=1 Tax=unclassified Pseudonocardia TaxID=2619320 RepID=UPI00086F6CC3|nr:MULTISPECIES: plasmid replication, integration and excision activator [unclassified Pseudonocardia]MBN9109616.1 plasmid replication, integration and excision activator [Pseudonocardia sp.]ODU24657.1 MAG: plasmid replication, integration and excision activator [Pseudonocardia sp. SCN 72-51]ODU99079.1 MAG: plasmid replication, integration and excision activator [Pseudonocardia sp. SCN 73-27]
MAIKSRFAVAMGDVFPHGAFVVSEVEQVRDFEKSSAGRPVQQLDKESGLPVWSVSVLDADPEARRSDKTVVVKIAAHVQPVPPEAVAGLPFRPVEFDGLTVTPYVAENGGRPRVAYSLRATGMRAPGGHAKPSPRQSNQDAA